VNNRKTENNKRYADKVSEITKEYKRSKVDFLSIANAMIETYELVFSIIYK
jgi:hypothetical protein